MFGVSQDAEETALRCPTAPATTVHVMPIRLHSSLHHTISVPTDAIVTHPIVLAVFLQPTRIQIIPLHHTLIFHNPLHHTLIYHNPLHHTLIFHKTPQEHHFHNRIQRVLRFSPFQQDIRLYLQVIKSLVNKSSRLPTRRHIGARRLIYQIL